MSVADSIVSPLERLGDWLNPILVKETRQALRSRQFVVTFLLMLIASWLLSVFGVLMAGDTLEYGSAGRAFFIGYFDVLALAIFAVVPYTAYRGLLNERDQTTLELLSITSLSPRQLVWGKLCSAMVQVFIYYSAIAPFIAFTSMLQGFDFALVIFTLSMSLIFTLCLTMLALMLAAVPQNKHVQGGTSLIVFGGLIWIVFAVLFGGAALLFETIPFDQRDFWIGLACFVAGALSYFFLFTQIATAHLTFESDNRSTGIRLACSAQFFLYWISMWAVEYFSATPAFRSHDFGGFCVIPTVHCLMVGFFISTEPDYVSRRVRRSYPESTLRRLAAVPFLPGGHRGFLYMLLHLALVPVMAMSVFGLVDFWNSWAGFWSVVMVMYVIAYVGLGAAFGRMLSGLSSEVRPIHTRVTILIGFAVGVIVPYLPSLFGPRRSEWLTQLLRVTNPFETLDRMSGSWGGLMGHEVPVVFVAATLGIVLNLKPMLRGIAEVLNEPIVVTPIEEDNRVLSPEL